MKDKEEIEIWVIKRALTKGIEKLRASTTGVEGMLSVPAGDTLGLLSEYYHGEGRGWFRTREEAVAAAEAMRLKKIKSMEKQLKKFKAMKFDEQ